MIDLVQSGTDHGASRSIIRLNVVGTGLFVVSAVVAAAVFTSPTRIVGVVVALGLFAIGVFTFLWGYWNAVQRSRTDDIAVAQLYFLAGGSTPRGVKRIMNSALAVQVVTSLATAIARPTTEGKSGSTLAFGILVPMFGLGLNGLWCAGHGSFSARVRELPPNSSSVPLSDGEMEQTATHG